MDEAFVVAEFFRQYMADKRAGAVKPLAAYQSPFPGHEATVAAEYQALESADAAAGDVEIPGGVPDGDLHAIGRYRILEEIGRGGQGTVYLAEDPSLGRNVALKVLSRLGAAAETTFARFQREALVASRLNHPGICKVYESGQEGALAYIAMEFVRGETLAARIARQRDEAGTPEPRRDRESSTRGHASKQSVREILQIGEKTARALHAAHEAGVIHRDIKPGNIIITEGHQPVVLDFGLARASEGDFRTLTRTGDFFGTPAYMSPEQVSTKSGRPDRRTDVYSLAATLYECLTLRPPFGPADPESLYHRILTEPAPRPSRLNRSVPHDLDVVLEKAMDKEPRRRYATALDFAEELARVGRFEPIHARAPGPVLRLRRWSQRNPVAAAFLLLLTLGLAGTLFLLNRVRIELRHARALGLVRESILAMETDPTLALLLAREAVRTEERSETVSQLQSAMAKSLAVARIPHKSRVSTADFSPDGTRLVTADNDGLAKIWRLDRDRWRPGPVLAHEVPLTGVCFFPNGDTILGACRDGTVTVWDVDGAPLTTFSASPSRGGWGQAFLSPDGNRILCVTGQPGKAKLWLRRGTNWQLERELPPGGPIWCGSFSRRGSRVVVGEGHFGLDQKGWSPRAMIFNIRNERSLELLGHEQSIRTAVFSPDDRLVLTTSMDRTARLWDAGNGRCLATLRHDAPVLSGRFFPGGDCFLTGSFDGTARIWNRDGNLVSVCMADGAVRHVAVAPDGTRILACSQGNRTLVFDRAGREIAILLGHKYTVFSGAFSPAGDHVATASADRTAILWKIDWSDYPVLRGHHGAITNVSLLEGGKGLVTCSLDCTVRFWDRAGKEMPERRVEFPWPVTRVSVSPQGGQIAATFWNGRLSIGDGTSERALNIPGYPGASRRVEFLRDGKRLLVTKSVPGSGGAALIVDLNGNVMQSFHHDSRVEATRLTADESRLVTITEQGEDVSIWDVQSGNRVARWPVTNPKARLRGADISADGRRILTTASDGTLQVWDAEGNELSCLICPYMITRCRFSPEGNIAVSAGRDGAVVWDLRSGAYSVLRAHQGSVNHAIFSPTGDAVLTAGDDGAVRTWPVRIKDLLEAADRRAYRDFTAEERERFAELLDD